MPRRERSSRSNLYRLLWLVFAAAAVYKELQLPPDERTWHGEVAGFVPYDFRLPTMDRVRARLWDPEGDLIGPQVFGVGWALNFGRAWQLAKELVES